MNEYNTSFALQTMSPATHCLFCLPGTNFRFSNKYIVFEVGGWVCHHSYSLVVFPPHSLSSYIKWIQERHLLSIRGMHSLIHPAMKHFPHITLTLCECQRVKIEEKNKNISNFCYFINFRTSANNHFSDTHLPRLVTLFLRLGVHQLTFTNSVQMSERIG